MKSKVVVTKLAHRKKKVTHQTLLLDYILNHNIKWSNLYNCTSNHVSTENIGSKSIYTHDFSRWPPYDISNIFINFVQHVNWYEYCYSIYQVSCQKLIYYNCYDFFKYLIKIQHPPFLKWIPFRQFQFSDWVHSWNCFQWPKLQLWKMSCFYHILNYSVLKICTYRLDYLDSCTLTRVKCA